MEAERLTDDEKSSPLGVRGSGDNKTTAESVDICCSDSGLMSLVLKESWDTMFRPTMESADVFSTGTSFD